MIRLREGDIRLMGQLDFYLVVKKVISVGFIDTFQFITEVPIMAEVINGVWGQEIDKN